MMTLTVERADLATGEFVAGTLSWKAERTERVRVFSVRAEWETKGRGNDVFCTAREAKWTSSPHDVEKEIPFRLLIPHDGPVSYSGLILNIEWKLIAQAEIDGSPGETVELELSVRPRRVHRPGATRSVQSESPGSPL